MLPKENLECRFPLLIKPAAFQPGVVSLFLPPGSKYGGQFQILSGKLPSGLGNRK